MKKKSEFSSKKVTELKSRRRKKSINITQPKKNNDFFCNQEIKQDLQSFYNSEAKKYAETRKKFWHEENAILDAITPLFEKEPPFDKGGAENSEAEGFCINGKSSTCPPCQMESEKIPPTPLIKGGNPEDGGIILTKGGHEKKVRVLEFGCGSGRFATLLNQNFPGKFDYVGIDLSDELLSYASKENPNLTFFQWDITKLIKNFEQESFDLIVWTSSFQHIPTTKERSFLMKNFYRLLDYDGMLLMTNRSLSDWFVKKNWKIVMKARLKSWLRLNNNARDLMVPRTDSNWKIYERFYHFFSLKELENLGNFAWLTVKLNKYIDENWIFTDDEKISRSSFFVAVKTPIIN